MNDDLRGGGKHRPLQCRRIEYIDHRRCRPERGDGSGVLRAARGAYDIVAGGAQQRRQPAPDYPARSGQKYLHGITRNYYAEPLSASSAWVTLAFRPVASSRFSFSSTTTSSGARAMKFSLLSLASTRAISDSAFCISLVSRARSAAMSMTPISGSAATSPRTTSCTEPFGAVAADEISDTRARRLMKSAQRSARLCVSLDAPANTSGIAAAIFISARIERMTVMSSISQPISASALSSVKPPSFGQSLSANSAERFGPCSAVTAQSSSVMKGMNGCSSFNISSSAQAAIARVSSLAGPSGPASSGFDSSTYQSQ